MEPREQYLDSPAGTLQVCAAATVPVPAPPTDTDSLTSSVASD